jgi:enoyl-CoA hydratase/carnithine racemase
MGALIIAEKIEPGITRIVLNDPDARNAMSDEMAVLFEQEVSRCSADPNLRVVIVSGAGQAFSAGGHLEMLLEKSKRSKDENVQGMLDFYRRFLSIASLPVPVIAAINGHAVGAGLCMALSCDIRIAAAGANFGLNFVQLGLHPGMGATYFLPRLIGPARAAELLYTGRIFAAEEALSFGIVNRLIEADKFNDAVLELARTIAQAGPQAVRALKKSLSIDAGKLGNCLEREAAAQAEDYSGLQFAEGIRAAMEKRRARF